MPGRCQRPTATGFEALLTSRIYQDTRKILDEPEFRQKQLIDRGYEVVGNSPDEFSKYIVRDRESRGRAVKISGAKAE